MLKTLSATSFAGRAIGVLITASFVGCGPHPTAPVAPTADEILAHQTMWANHAPNHYSFQFKTIGTQSGFANSPIRIEVRGDTVLSVTDVQTGQAWPGPYPFFPTVDLMFSVALERLNEHALTAIAFDSQWGYPVRIDTFGPDIGGSEFASMLTPLP